MSLCQTTEKTNSISEYSSRKHFGWNHICCDRQRDRCTVEWVKTRGWQWRGVGPQIRGPFPSPAFSIKPQHTGNNLWTWPSNSPAPALSPGSQPLPPPNYIKPTPSTPLTLRPTTHTTSWQDKPNVAHAKLYMYYVCSQTLARRIRSPVFTLGGQWLFFSTGSKVSNKKIQYSKCTGSPAYQYII